MLEDLSHQKMGMGDWAETLNRHAFERASTVITSEHRRLQEDSRTIHFEPKSQIEILNVSKSIKTKPQPQSRREKSVLAAGSIGPQACSDFLLSDLVSGIEFNVAGPNDTELSHRFLNNVSMRPNLNYMGL